MMDIFTPRGQKFLALEGNMARWWETKTGWTYTPTPKDKPAAVDALLFNKAGDLAGVAESKCRDCDMDTMRDAFNMEWLITFDKIEKACRVAEGLRVPLFLFLYLKDSGEILVVKAADEQGNITVPLRLDWTETKASCNGGQAERLNAYVKLQNAKIYETNCLTRKARGL